jgi:hypothetical protein
VLPLSIFPLASFDAGSIDQGQAVAIPAVFLTGSLDCAEAVNSRQQDQAHDGYDASSGYRRYARA